MKRILPLSLFALALLLLMLSSSADAENETSVFDDGCLVYVVEEGDTVYVADYIEGCGVSDVVIPSTVIHDGISYTVTSVGEIDDDAIISLTIPETVDSISTTLYMHNLERIVVDEGNSHYASADGVLFSKYYSELLRYPVGKLDEVYEVPSAVDFIAALSFEGTKLKEIIIQKTTSTIDFLAFNWCTNLERITVEPGNPNYSSIDGVLFDDIVQELILYPRGRAAEVYDVPESVSVIGGSSFAYSAVKEIIFHRNLVMIGEYAFEECVLLEKMSFNLGGKSSLMTVMGTYAFLNCVSLASIEIPPTVQFIGNGCFSGTAIEEVSLPIGLSIFGDSVFANCYNLRTIVTNSDTFIVRDGVLYQKVGDASYTLMCYPAALPAEKFTMPDEVTEIAFNAFAGTKNLKEVVMNSMVSLPQRAFSYSLSLETIDLSNVYIISDMAFYGCSHLKNIHFGKNLSSIGMLAFYGTGITEIEIPESVLMLDYLAFSACSDLRLVSIPESSKVILEVAVFYGDTNLEKLVINSSDVILGEDSLSVGDESSWGDPFVLHIEIPSGYHVPDNATNSDTILDITVIGERPYPYENFIGIGFCIILLIAILMFVREV